ncbi:MAG: hypothetical protein ACKO63_04645, partial [Nodosilinea sp.]
MDNLPFTIQKFVFERNLPKILNLGETPDAQAGPEGSIPGYFVMSSAPPNIEEAKEADALLQQQAAQGVEEIADRLHQMISQAPDSSAELVIAIHGYNTNRQGVINWYSSIFKFINQHDTALRNQTNRVFIGYRWPSENVDFSPKKIGEALTALPRLPRDILILGGIGALLLLLLKGMTVKAIAPLWPHSWITLLVNLALVVVFICGILMAALVVLRLIVYFRDYYRADNFGVLDMVELLRQIDHALLCRTASGGSDDLQALA